MATKVEFKTTFEAKKTIEPIFTGGEVSSNATGSLIATCVEDDVLVVDIKTVSVLCRIEGDGEPVTSLCLAPNASCLAISSRSLSLRIYSLTPSPDSSVLEHKLLRTLKPHNTPVVSSAIDATGTLLATGAADGSLKVWDIRGGYTSHTFHGHGGLISALKFFTADSGGVATQANSKSSRKRKSREEEQEESLPSKSIHLASGSEDGKIQIWNLSARKSIAALDSHVSVVRSLCYSEDTGILLSASRDRTIILWDSTTWKQQRVIPALEVLETAGFLNEGQQCFVGGEHGIVRIWDTTTAREITPKQTPGLENDSISAIFHVADEDALLSVHQDQTLRFHDITKLGTRFGTGEPLVLPLLRTISGNFDEVIDMTCVGRDRSLVALATNTESVKLISIKESAQDSSRSEPNFGSDVAVLEGHQDIIICLDVDWSGLWLATGAKDNTARLWRLDPESSSYKCFAIFAGHAESLGAVALPRSPPSDGPALRAPADHPPAFLLTGSQDKTIKRWDTSKLKYSPSSTEPHTGSKALYTRVAHDKDINSLDASAVAPLFASASQDRTIKVWSLEDGSVTGILRGHKRGVWSVRFSPAGTPPVNLSEGGTSGSRGLLVSGSGDRTVKVWSLSTYTCLQTFEGHSNSVLKVLWLPPSTPSNQDSDSSREPRQTHNNKPMIASASADTLVKLWSPYSGADSNHLLATLDNHTDRVWALTSPTSFPQATKSANSQSGKAYPLISGAADATLTFWEDTTVQTANTASLKASARIEQDQQLQNHINAKNYREAIVLSLTLNHPGRLLHIFQDVVNLPESEKQPDSIMGVTEVDDVLASLDHLQLYTLLERVRDWNTNARTATVAQRVLNCIFKRYHASVFLDMARDRRLKGLKDVMRALEVYTERHYKRMDDLADESYLIDYTLREMDGVGRGLTGADRGDDDVIMV
ncbi:hypothetical protein B0A52_02885 [Exophiala mesophila]|uniref:U3 small nucleolar RNA-associated protein 13 C-terminal domain-containing protein n=1 Tax=Exophiala mesophila TaxID=212818 RepID=A0A438NE67_EXOME|nr:hypothetical protein B0A52_02885 [Exophiala mesophila]